MKKSRKTSKRDRSDNDDSVPPLKGSIKVISLEDAPVRLMNYNKEFNGFSFSLIPWGVIDKHILAHLDHHDTMMVAQTTRQWYRRIANVACRKFAIFLPREIEALRAKDKFDKYNRKEFDELGDLKIIYEKLTPMAVAYYHDLGRATWDRNFKRTGTANKSRGPHEMNRELIVMLKRIREHGSIDSFKAYTIVNNARLVRNFEIKVAKYRKMLAGFNDNLRKVGYNSRLELIILPRSNRLKIEPCVVDNIRGDPDSDEERHRKDVLAKLYHALKDCDEIELANFDPREIGGYLLQRGWATTIPK